MELQRYEDKNVFAFDCASISAFDTESEMLFFGETILEIYTIRQKSNNKNYIHYIQGIKGLLSIINGTTPQNIIGHTIVDLIKHIIPTHIEAYKMSNIPPFIEKHLKYHLNTAQNK